MNLYCMACGVVKDLDVLEMYPYEGSIDTEEPVPPLLVIECQGSKARSGTSAWKAVVVCHQCFHRLDPDMWIRENKWQSLNPQTSFAQLPEVFDSEKDPQSKWDPRSYFPNNNDQGRLVVPLRKRQKTKTSDKTKVVKDSAQKSVITPVIPDQEHPDVTLCYVFCNGQTGISLRITTLETPDFPLGVLLNYSYTGEDAVKEAKAQAVRVQKYLNGLKHAWTTDYSGD